MFQSCPPIAQRVPHQNRYVWNVHVKAFVATCDPERSRSGPEKALLSIVCPCIGIVLCQIARIACRRSWALSVCSSGVCRVLARTMIARSPQVFRKLLFPLGLGHRNFDDLVQTSGSFCGNTFYRGGPNAERFDDRQAPTIC